MPLNHRFTGDSDPTSHDTEEFYRLLREEFFVPYSDEELSYHTADRDLKNALEERHARNYRIIKLLRKWISHLFYSGPKPHTNVGEVLLNEASEAKPINAPSPIKVICDTLIEYGPGLMPELKIAVYCSRSTAKLYSYLHMIHSTASLASLIEAERRLLELVTNQKVLAYDQSSFAKLVRQIYGQILSNTRAYGSELCAFLHTKEQEHALRKSGNSAALSPTIGDMKNALKQTEKHISKTIVSATEGEGNKGCHHRDKKKDILIQKIIKHLAKPGIVFSIHNACERLFGLDHRTKLPWLYDWCHRHKSDIERAADILRAIDNPT